MGAVINPFTGKIDITGTGGSGTVTKVSVTTANGVSGSVATDTTTPAISLSLGAITPSSVNGVTLSGSSTPTLAVTGTTTVSGANTGDNVEVAGQTTGFSITKGTTPKTLTVNKTITLTSPDDTSVSTLPAGAKTLVATDGNISGSSGSCTGNSATVTGLSVTSGKTLTVTDNATISGTPLSNPLTTLGDILYEDATPAPARLAGNTTSTKKFLRQTGNGAISAVPAWDTIATTDIPDISATYLPLHGKADTAGVADSATGNAGTVTNGVYNTGNQSIAGIKTFSDATEASNATTGGTIVSGGLAVAKRVYATDMTVTNKITGSISGNADGTASNLSGTPTLPSGTTLVAPVLGTPASGVLTNCTGTATGLTAGGNVKSDGTVNSTNLLSNGRLDGWSSGASAVPDGFILKETPTIARETNTSPIVADYHIKITSVGANYEGIQIAGGTGNYLKVRGSRIYTLSFYYKVDSGGDVGGFNVVSYNGATAGTGHHDSGNDLNSTTWVLKTFTFTTDATATNLQLQWYSFLDTDVLYLAGLQLVEGESAFAFSDKPVGSSSSWLPIVSNSINLGGASNKFNDIYCGNNLYASASKIRSKSGYFSGGGAINILLDGQTSGQWIVDAMINHNNGDNHALKRWVMFACANGTTYIKEIDSTTSGSGYGITLTDTGANWTVTFTDSNGYNNYYFLKVECFAGTMLDF